MCAHKSVLGCLLLAAAPVRNNAKRKGKRKEGHSSRGQADSCGPNANKEKLVAMHAVVCQRQHRCYLRSNPCVLYRTY